MAVLLLFILALSFSITTSFAAETSTTSQVKQTFTNAQINTAATSVKTFVEKNKRLPNYVTIGNKQVTTAQYLKLATVNTIYMNSKTSKSVTVAKVTYPSNATETVKSGDISKAQLVKMASTINKYINTNKRAPRLVTTTQGKINFQNMVYTYSKALDFQAKNKRLPNYVSVKSWNAISKTASAGSEGSGTRPVYILSDNINNKAIDNDRINRIVTELKKLGIKAYNMGAGTNNIAVFKKIPSNALVVQIMGGACAATIKETGSTWYKNILGNRKLFLVWTEGAKKITGLKWLERAHDDNFSAASFKGLANPDKYLLSHGYQYYEGYTNSKVSILAKLILSQAKG